VRRIILAWTLALGALASVAVAAPIVRFDVIGMGSFDIQLHDNTPLHRDNFLQYVTAGLYAGSIVHRSDAGNRVIQGGGYALSADPNYLLAYVPAYAPIAYEGHLADSNVLMTVGAARTANPDSATSQWFVNMGDNSGWFDDRPGTPGYTVFGHIVAGWDVCLAIYGLNVWNAGSPFDNLPLHDTFDNTGPITQADFVTIGGASIVPEPATLGLAAVGVLALLRRRR